MKIYILYKKYVIFFIIFYILCIKEGIFYNIDYILYIGYVIY